MNAQITERKGNRITLKVDIELTGSMLEMEEQILEGVNEMGTVASGEALKRFDADGENIVIGGTTWYSKGQLNKTYHSPYGDVVVDRHVYQRAEGGTTMCPLEDQARIIIRATPRFAKVIAHKFANNAVPQVVEDLEQNHGRQCQKSTLQDVTAYVGTIVQAKEESWDYEMPDFGGKVTTIGIGTDGTCMLLCHKQSTTPKSAKGAGVGTQEGGSMKWREAMTGTLSLYDKDGERLHTIYVGTAPEYGKKAFYERMTREIDRVKTLYPKARTVGIADGASSNWEFLAPFVEKQILDFYHATEYLTKASEALKVNENDRTVWLDEACHNLKHNRNAAKNLLREMQKAMDETKTLKKDPRKNLQAAITYFSNHITQMNYAEYREAGYPIGSGVTEAACKVLVKQRLCCSGMRWTPPGAQNILSIRALVKTDCRWDQFWKKISQYGIPKNITH